MSRARTDEEVKIFLFEKSERITDSGCWIWLGGLDKDGYGQTWYKGKNIRAHRLSWQLKNGLIPEGMHIMHMCDIPTCINPNHLRCGTGKENNDDKMKKNRHRVASGDSHYMRLRPNSRAGELCPTVKLTEQKVKEILIKLSKGIKQEKLAIEYGVTRTAISAISTRRTWKHIKLTTEQ